MQIYVLIVFNANIVSLNFLLRMAEFSEYERSVLKGTSVEEVLKAFSCNTEHGRDNLYFSPFRDECAPSFHISRDGRSWYDFGMGRGGSSVTLVCMMLGCDARKAYDFLSSISGTFFHATEPSERLTGRGVCHSSKITVLSADQSVSERSLVRYAARRGVSAAVLNTYCRQITFSYADFPTFRSTCIGFRNNSGGWVMRAPDVKKCSGSDITTIDIYGEQSGRTTSPMGLMFEGFFDFLSFMEISGGGWPRCDVCVLNSVGNIGRAREWMAAHKQICTLFDNDDSGVKTLGRVREWMAADAAERVVVNDWSGLYRGYNDLNDRLTDGVQQKEQLSIQYQSLWNRTFQQKFRRD